MCAHPSASPHSRHTRCQPLWPRHRSPSQPWPCPWPQHHSRCRTSAGQTCEQAGQLLAPGCSPCRAVACIGVRRSHARRPLHSAGRAAHMCTCNTTQHQQCLHVSMLCFTRPERVRRSAAPLSHPPRSSVAWHMAGQGTGSSPEQPPGRTAGRRWQPWRWRRPRSWRCHSRSSARMATCSGTEGGEGG